MTKLTKPVIREVTLNGKVYYVTLDPGNDTPMVSFREKGKRGRNAPFFLIPLDELLDQLSGIAVAEGTRKWTGRQGISSSDMLDKLSQEDEIYVTSEETYGVPQKLTISIKGKSEWVTDIDQWSRSH